MVRTTDLPECGWSETSFKLEEKFNSGQRHRLPRPAHRDVRVVEIMVVMVVMVMVIVVVIVRCGGGANDDHG